MDQRAIERQAEIRTLIDSDALTLEQARTALRALLDVTASAQTGPDVTSYGYGMDLPREVVDAEYAGRETVGYDLDGLLLGALRPATA
ncbi:hypothetical protein [Streptomyces violascens]|uniref:hypothetical protein n=1 Tax=Streptomyces violascens TaxID=67381 RepID=UPI001672D649|nr:hypothetical protein [Streptomyces violascens]GGU38787.1 hypothetical protein GCM10010289_69590 [Streptomyces violascens]